MSDYAVDHGTSDVLGHPMTVERLTGLLAASWDDYQRGHHDRGATWAAHTAREVAAET